MQQFYDCPQVLRDFLAYHETIKGQSELTISEYYLDLRMFLRFIKLMRNEMPVTTQLEDIPIKDIDLNFIKEITTSDVFDFLSYLSRDRVPNQESSSYKKGIASSAGAALTSALAAMGTAKAAALLGTAVIPGLGTAIGAIVGFLVGLGIDFFFEQTVDEHIINIVETN